MIKNPCKNCEFRILGCHSHCEKFLEWKKQRIDILKELRETKKIDEYVGDQIYKNSQRAKR